jgi:hypothetical protein
MARGSRASIAKLAAWYACLVKTCRGILETPADLRHAEDAGAEVGATRPSAPCARHFVRARVKKTPT